MCFYLQGGREGGHHGEEGPGSVKTPVLHLLHFTQALVITGPQHG